MDHTHGNAAADRPQAISDSAGKTAFDAPALLAQAPEVARQNGSNNTASNFLPGLDLGDFQDRAKVILQNMPTDKSGHIAPDALVAMVANPDIKGQDAVVAATLYRSYRTTSGSDDSASNTDTKFTPGGFDSGIRLVTSGGAVLPHALKAGDIAALRPLPVDEAKNMEALQKLAELKGFNAADKNHDGRLTTAELNASPQFAKMLANEPALLKQLQESPRGLKRSDIGSFADSEAYADHRLTDLQKQGGYVAKNFGLTQNHDLFADKVNPLNSIKIGDVQQGSAGDCYFAAVLAGVADKNPALIRDAISTNKDGSYTVTFKGDPMHPVTVKAPTDTELALYAPGSKDGVWAPVMEKAFAKYSVDVLHRPQADGTPQDATNGGLEKTVMRLLTGHEPQSLLTAAELKNERKAGGDDASLAPAIESAVKKALAEGKAVTVGVGDGQPADSHIDERHAYTVVGFETGPNGCVLRLSDPRGKSFSDGGRPALSLDALKTQAFNFTIEQK